MDAPFSHIIRRYLRFEQIQDGGHRHVGKISNGHISGSATGRLIDFLFRSKIYTFYVVSLV